MAYLDMPLLPGVVDTPVRNTPVGQAIEALYGVVQGVAQGGVNAFLGSIDEVAKRAFGERDGPLYAAGVRLILRPFTELVAQDSPKLFVQNTLSTLIRLDEFLALFLDERGKRGKQGYFNVVNGVPVAPGLWRFEELKRVFPVGSPLMQRLFGYGSFFAAWNQVDATIVPDFTADWANPAEYIIALVSRLVGFWHIPVIIDIHPYPPNIYIYPDLPRYMPLAPYFLPFVGERTYWGWFNVPEGYPLPLVKGIPGGALPSLGSDHPMGSAKASQALGGIPGLLGLYERFLGQEPKANTGGAP